MGVSVFVLGRWDERGKTLDDMRKTISYHYLMVDEIEKWEDVIDEVEGDPLESIEREWEIVRINGREYHIRDYVEIKLKEGCVFGTTVPSSYAISAFIESDFKNLSLYILVGEEVATSEDGIVIEVHDLIAEIDPDTFFQYSDEIESLFRRFDYKNLDSLPAYLERLRTFLSEIQPESGYLKVEEVGQCGK